MSKRTRVLAAALLLICSTTIVSAAPLNDDGGPSLHRLIRQVISKIHHLIAPEDDGTLSLPKP